MRILLLDGKKGQNAILSSLRELGCLDFQAVNHVKTPNLNKWLKHGGLMKMRWDGKQFVANLGDVGGYFSNEVIKSKNLNNLFKSIEIEVKLLRKQNKDLHQRIVSGDLIGFDLPLNVTGWPPITKECIRRNQAS